MYQAGERLFGFNPVNPIQKYENSPISISLSFRTVTDNHPVPVHAQIEIYQSINGYGYFVATTSCGDCNILFLFLLILFIYIQDRKLWKFVHVLNGWWSTNFSFKIFRRESKNRERVCSPAKWNAWTKRYKRRPDFVKLATVNLLRRAVHRSLSVHYRRIGWNRRWRGIQFSSDCERIARDQSEQLTFFTCRHRRSSPP